MYACINGYCVKVVLMIIYNYTKTFQKTIESIKIATEIESAKNLEWNKSYVTEVVSLASEGAKYLEWNKPYLTQVCVHPVSKSLFLNSLLFIWPKEKNGSQQSEWMRTRKWKSAIRMNEISEQTHKNMWLYIEICDSKY